MRRFYVLFGGEQAPAGVTAFTVGDTLITGESDFTQAFGTPSTLEEDLLRIASTVFAADRAYARGEREDVNRRFEVSIPVVNVGRLLPLAPLVEQALYRLSNDTWNIHFRQIAGNPEQAMAMPASHGRTLLFSGGLDSLAAAIEYGQVPGALQLISHRTRNQITITSQRELWDGLTQLGLELPYRTCFVSSRSDTSLDHDEENSQRTRSFVFLTLGALMARRSGHHEVIFLAENGQMAIHLPLTQGRVGAFSTHTAHPEVLASLEAFLSSALNFRIKITNPYVHRTKKEVVEVIHLFSPALLFRSNSCWKNARLPSGATHCGVCAPCFIRRIAIESFQQDCTLYARDPWREDVSMMGPDDEARRNLADLAELVKRFETESNEDILSEWPELYSDDVDAVQVMAMYRRFATEARAVLCHYPNLAPFLR